MLRSGRQRRIGRCDEQGSLHTARKPGLNVLVSRNETFKWDPTATDIASISQRIPTFPCQQAEAGMYGRHQLDEIQH